MGTTSTCAIDDVSRAARVLEANPMIWGHADAAYAGAAMICPEYQHLAEYTSSFDSFNVNLNKWLLINADAR
jgi:aromatic-L-amino-acid decarboxylase